MKNRFQATKTGNIIEIKITAVSQETADKIFELINRFGIETVRFDLEQEWNNPPSSEH